jgi:hypothetical protein
MSSSGRGLGGAPQWWPVLAGLAGVAGVAGLAGSAGMASCVGLTGVVAVADMAARAGRPRRGRRKRRAHRRAPVSILASHPERSLEELCENACSQWLTFSRLSPDEC